MRRLIPEPGETSVDEQLAELDLQERAGEERPYVVTNFAVTLEGSATVGGRSGPIGSSTDTALFHGLRSRVDAVMVGAGTLRVEGYGRIIEDPAVRSRRERIGLSHDPLAVIVTGSLELPWDAPIFTEGGRVLILTSSDRDPPETASSLRIQRYTDHVDLASALSMLRRERGVRALLCEGGPHLHAELVAGGLVDELFVTIAPTLAGGGGPGLMEGLPEKERDLELVWLLEEGGELFARYRITADSPE